MKKTQPGFGLRRAILIVALLAACGCSEDKKMRVDREARTLSLRATVSAQGQYKELGGAIEYVLVGTGGKAYETLFVTEHPVEEIYSALLTLGLRPGQAADEKCPPRGQPVNIFVEHGSGRKRQRVPVETFLLRVTPGADENAAAPAPLSRCPWPFTGSAMATHPETKKDILQASLTQSIVGLHRADASVFLQNPRPEAVQQNIYHANLAALPPAGTPVRIVFQRPKAEVSPGTRRSHVLLSGRVQGVGFRVFTEGRARRLNVSGFVRNLPDGRVEALLEGPEAGVATLLEEMRRGTLPTRVEEMQVGDEAPEGDLSSPFEIWY